MNELDWLIDFGQNLREFMYEAGVTQKDLAIKLNISQSTISRYLNGTQMPTAKVIVNLSYALDRDISELIDFGSIIY